jgi:hypothetical protein
MAIIHKTTLVPGKLELLGEWMPTQPWYVGPGPELALAKAGGFRLDDPAGEVGIEFMVVSDGAVTYLVPLTYRGAALPEAEASLIGTSEHGVLGRRWVYDGTGDPVLVAQLIALIQGKAEAQAQSLSSTPDPEVTGIPVAGLSLTGTGVLVASDKAGTDLRVETGSGEGFAGRPVTLRVHRMLRPGGSTGSGDEAGVPCLSGTWRLPDGTPARGIFATIQDRPGFAAGS